MPDDSDVAADAEAKPLAKNGGCDDENVKAGSEVPVRLLERLLELQRKSVAIAKTWAELSGDESCNRSDTRILTDLTDEMEDLVTENESLISNFKSRRSCSDDRKNDRLVPYDGSPERRKKRQKRGDESSQTAGCNVFVFHLPDDWTDDTLFENFIGFGNIKSSKVMMEGTRSRGFGFVHFEDRFSADMAIKNMNGQQVKGKKESKRLKVEMKRTK